MKKNFRTLSVLLVICLLLTACGGGSSSPGTGNPSASTPAAPGVDAFATPSDRILYERTLAEASTYDPYMNSDIYDWRYLYNIFDSLFYETQDGAFVPALCTDYSFNETGDEMTFVIREGVKFHDGSTMTTDDVVYSLNASIASSATSRHTAVMDHAEDNGDGTVTLYLKSPCGPIIGYLTNVQLAIVPRAIHEPDPAAFGKKPIGTGPYVLTDVRSGESSTLEAFPDYWRGEAPIKKIVTHVIVDNTAAVMAIESGEIQWMQPSQDYSDKQALTNNPNLTYYETAGAIFYAVAFNHYSEKFSDVRVRQAVAYAIDKEDLMWGAIDGNGVVCEPCVPEAFAQYPENFEPLGYDLEKAKALLTEAGYPDGFDVTMRVIGATNYTKASEIIQAQLKKIGINVTIETYDRAPWFEKVFSGGDYELSYYAHSATVNDADFTTYPWFHSSEADGKGSNFYNYKNPELDKLLEEGRSSLDEARRKEIYAQIADIVRDDAVCVPTYSNFRTLVAHNDLKGVYADASQRYYKYNYHW